MANTDFNVRSMIPALPDEKIGAYCRRPVRVRCRLMQFSGQRIATRCCSESIMIFWCVGYMIRN